MAVLMFRPVPLDGFRPKIKWILQYPTDMKIEEYLVKTTKPQIIVKEEGGYKLPPVMYEWEEMTIQVEDKLFSGDSIMYEHLNKEYFQGHKPKKSTFDEGSIKKNIVLIKCSADGIQLEKYVLIGCYFFAPNEIEDDESSFFYEPIKFSIIPDKIYLE